MPYVFYFSISLFILCFKTYFYSPDRRPISWIKNSLDEKSDFSKNLELIVYFLLVWIIWISLRSNKRSIVVDSLLLKSLSWSMDCHSMRVPNLKNDKQNNCRHSLMHSSRLKAKSLKIHYWCLSVLRLIKD